MSTRVFHDCIILTNTFEPAFYGSEEKAKTELIETIRDCCLRNGFFQITGHNVPAKLQKSMLECTKRLFALPQEYKDAVLKGEENLLSGHCPLHSNCIQTKTPGTEATKR